MDHKRRRGLRPVSAALAAALLVAGCSGGGDSASPDRAGRRTPWPTAELASALVPYDDCDALLEDVKQAALERIGPYGLEPMTFARTGMAINGGPTALEATSGDATSGAPPSTIPVGRDAAASSSTNVQVAGVDEPDTVKLDGTTMYSTVDGRLLVTDLSGDSPALTATLDVGGAPSQLLLDGDRLLVLSNGWGGTFEVVGPTTRSVPSEPGGAVVATELRLVDVSDPSAPRVVEHRSVDGSLLGARMVGGRARLVTATTGHDLGFVYPSGSSGEASAEAANRRVIEGSQLEDWLPRSRTLAEDGTVESSEQLVDCADVSTPGVYSGQGTLSVLSVDVGDGSLAAEDAVAVQATGETIYASADTLYVATREVLPAELSDDPGQAGADDLVTAVHAFDITGDGPATYLATGEVRGRLLNQFSLDEHEGVLRVATTVGPTWGVVMSAGPDGEVRTDGAPSESFVTTLERRDGELVELGRVGDMGHGEQIHSVRFLGDVGYVVTFRQTDPLYTLDLSDPSRPAVTGELKIPGFSSYLHPTDPGKLIGIGQDATDTGMRTGTQVSVFDVTDPADPQRTAQWTLPGGYSMAEGDHHAFLWWPDDDLLVIPASGGLMSADGALPGRGGWFEGAIGLDVSNTSITERGRIVHDSAATVVVEPDDPQSGSSSTTSTAVGGDEAGLQEPEALERLPVEEPWDPAAYTPPIIRTLVVEGRLVTISEVGILISALDTFAPLGWLPTEA